ncbi:hypothetical protein ACEZCY_21670 [Streptacidiphilus sp. N1-12]|uniref:Uncharacterized protein n=2 Tax=Streptacidiphilus alkalitolerans TaxID=3342712 RepID=A0ABV6WIE8_9ACTN
MPAIVVETPEPVLMEPKGPVITAIACTVGAVLTLAGVVGAGFCVVRAVTGAGGTRGGWVWVAVGLALVLLIVAWTGFSTIVNARDERAATLQLEAVGVDTTALVLSVASARASADDHPQVRLLLRVTGPGFETFESSHEVSAFEFGRSAQGTRLPVRVNPNTRAFVLRRAPAP